MTVGKRRAVRSARGLSLFVVVVALVALSLQGTASGAATYTLSGAIETSSISVPGEFEALISAAGSSTVLETAVATGVGSATNLNWVAAPLPAGEYTVMLHYVGTEDVPDVRAINLAGLPACTIPGCTVNLTQNINIGITQMLPGFEIQGTVIDDITHLPLTGIQVTIYSNPDFSPLGSESAVTDSNGHYDLRDISFDFCGLQFYDPTGNHAPVGRGGVDFDFLADNNCEPHQTENIENASMQQSSTISGSLTVPTGLASDFAAGRVSADLQYFVPGSIDQTGGYGDTNLKQTLSFVGNVAQYSFAALPKANYQVVFTYLGPTRQGSVSAGNLIVSTEGSAIVQNATLPALDPTPLVSGGVGDLNGDHNRDILARDAAGTLWLYPGDGQSGFLPRRQVATGLQGYNAVTSVADVSGNVSLFARDINGNLWMYSSVSAGGYYELLPVASGWQGVTAIEGVGDFNSDGLPELLARTSSGAIDLYSVNNTTAPLGPAVQIATGWSGMTAIVGAGDFNGDGFPDILARDAAGTLWLYPGNGADALGTPVALGTGWNGFSIVSVGDFNHDQKQDVLARDSSGTLWLYPGNGSNGFLPRVALGSGWNGLSIVGDGTSITVVPQFVTLPTPMTFRVFGAGSTPSAAEFAASAAPPASTVTDVSSVELTTLALSDQREPRVAAR